MTRDPFPLAWPDNWPRTPTDDRLRAIFRLSLGEAVQDTLYELEMMDATDVVITSDLPTRRDGLSIDRDHYWDIIHTSGSRAELAARLLSYARALHRAAIRTAHPDAGGSNERATVLNVALQECETFCESLNPPHPEITR